MWPTFAVSVIAGFCIDFIKNGSFSIDNAVKCSAVGSQLQTSFRACAIAQIMCGPLLLFCIVLVCWYVCFQRQDLAWNTFLFFVSIFVATDIVFEVRVLGNSAASLVLSYAMLFGVVCLFLLTELMNARAQRKARDAVSDDKKMYQKSWDALREDKYEKLELLILNSQLNSNSKINLKAFDEALKSAGSVEVLQDCKDIDVLYARAEFINDAFQSLVSVLLETGLPAKPAAETKAAVEANAAAKAELSSEAKAAAEAKAASNISRLKKDLQEYFAEVDIEEILQNLKIQYETTLNHSKAHNLDETEEQLSGQPMDTEQNDQPGKEWYHFSRFHFKRCFKVVPVEQAHADDTRVDIRSNSAVHGFQDQNETARQLNKKGDEHDNVPAVLVRRGPVKLPARAIAKVGPPLSNSPIMTFKPRPMQAEV
jgi:hypothetical protein